MKAYYSQGEYTIYHGDWREILPQLSLVGINLVLTDPPYPDYHTDVYAQSEIEFLKDIACQQIIFWSAKCVFPLDYTAIHIWDKKTGCGSEYERVFERNGNRNYKVFRDYLINSTRSVSWRSDPFTGHPSQKPVRLLGELICKLAPNSDAILDPFMGSGSTLAAAQLLGRWAIGIEVEERWCEVAAKRLEQGSLFVSERLGQREPVQMELVA